MSPTQRLELEILDIDEDLEALAKVYPNVEPIIARIPDVLGLCVHLMDGADVQELCCSPREGGDK